MILALFLEAGIQFLSFCQKNAQTTTLLLLALFFAIINNAAVTSPEHVSLCTCAMVALQ